MVKKKITHGKETFLFFFSLAPTTQWTQILFTAIFTFFRVPSAAPEDPPGWGGEAGRGKSAPARTASPPLLGGEKRVGEGEFLGEARLAALGEGRRGRAASQREQSGPREAVFQEIAV